MYIRCHSYVEGCLRDDRDDKAEAGVEVVTCQGAWSTGSMYPADVSIYAQTLAFQD